MQRLLFSLTVDADVWQEDDVFVSHCPALDVYSQGDTEQEARTNLVEALQLFIEVCYEHGTLDAVMKERGFTVDQEALAPDGASAASGLKHPITVPVALHA